jgi:hypothetical protein
MQLGSKVLPLPYIILYLAQKCVGPTREGTIDAKAITQTSHLRRTNDLGISRYAPLAQLGKPRSNSPCHSPCPSAVAAAPTTKRNVVHWLTV